jgi:hypothetical protein
MIGAYDNVPHLSRGHTILTSRELTWREDSVSPALLSRNSFVFQTVPSEE